VTKAGVVPANCEMAVDSHGAKASGYTPILGKEILEYERKPDHQGWLRDQACCYLFGTLADIDHIHAAALPLERSRKVSHTKIALILITKKNNIWISRRHDWLRAADALCCGGERLLLPASGDLGGLRSALGKCAIGRGRRLQ